MRRKRIIISEGGLDSNNINNNNRNSNYLINNLNINNNYNNINNNINNNHINNYNNNLFPNNNISLHSSISYMNPKTSIILPNSQNMKINSRSRSNKKKVEFEKKKELEKIKKDNELKEQLKDHFKCYICLEKVKKPKMCPYCKRNSCEQCIYKWIENHSNCGICKHSLSKNDLIEIPFLDEMSSFFMKDIDNKEKFQKMLNDEESNKKNKANGPKNSGPVKIFNMMSNKKEESKNKNKNFYNNFINNNISNNINNNISNNINNDISNNFDNNININYNQGNNSRTIISNNNNISNIIEMNDGEDEEICLEHSKKLEFFCIQCNKYFCGQCLVFFGEEVKKHKNHFVIKVNKLNDPRIKEAEIEYRKLPDTRNKITDCIKLCNMKIKQNEIQKYEAIKFLNYIKSFYINKIENESQKVRYSLNAINALKYEFENKKNDIFNKYSNLLNQNNNMAYQQMLQELQTLNNSASTANTDIIIFEDPNNSPKLFTENYQSDFIEFYIQTMPNGRIPEGAELVNFNINRIPEASCQLNIKHSHDIVTISFRASIVNPSIGANFLAYLIFKNPELGLEFIDLSENYSLRNDGKEQTNFIRLDAKKFLLLCDERKNIYFKIFITKSFYK